MKIVAWLYGIALVSWTLVYFVYASGFFGAEPTGALHQIFFAMHWILTALTLIAWGLLAVVVALVR